MKRILTHEKQRASYFIEILQSLLEFRDDPIMFSRDFNIWVVLKNLSEKDWELDKFTDEELEKIIKILVDLFYGIDIKGTTSNIKGILGNLMKFKPNLKLMV